MGENNNDKDEEKVMLDSQITDTYNEAVIVQKVEANKESIVMHRNVTDTMPAQTQQMYSHPISVSAELPRMGSITMNEYPSKEITALEDMRPSFIVTLPNKDIENEMEEAAGDPINTRVNYHEQAKNNQNNNENYIVTTNKTDNDQSGCCVACVCL